MTTDPFAFYGKKVLKCADRSKFLQRDESYTVCGVELGLHGDQGSNGARGDIRAFDKMGSKTVTGHTHTPGIIGGAYQVGTNSVLRLEYNPGPSSWLHTDCILYANGKRSLVNFINGKFRR